MTLDGFFFIAAIAAFLVGLSKGGLSSISMLAVPLMALHMSPVAAAVLLLPIFVISDVAGVYLYRHQFSAQHLRILIPAGLAGVLIGWMTASYTSDRAIKLMIGVLGVAFCLNVWLRQKHSAPQKPAHQASGWFWGLLAGFTSFISHSGGPPFQVYMLPQKLPKAQFAGTATFFFATINAAKILPYQLLRPYSLSSLLQSAWLIPFAMAGAVSGAWLTRRLPERWFFLFVQIGLFVVSGKLLIEALNG